MKLILVRHGESTYNRDKLCQGHSNSDLSDLGKKQVKLLSERFKDIEFSQIFSSDLLRAKLTAQTII